METTSKRQQLNYEDFIKEHGTKKGMQKIFERIFSGQLILSPVYQLDLGEDAPMTGEYNEDVAQHMREDLYNLIYRTENRNESQLREATQQLLDYARRFGDKPNLDFIDALSNIVYGMRGETQEQKTDFFGQLAEGYYQTASLLQLQINNLSTIKISRWSVMVRKNQANKISGLRRSLNDSLQKTLKYNGLSRLNGPKK